MKNLVYDYEIQSNLTREIKLFKNLFLENLDSIEQNESGDNQLVRVYSQAHEKSCNACNKRYRTGKRKRRLFIF